MFGEGKLDFKTLYWLSFGLPLIVGIVVAPTTLKMMDETILSFVQAIAIAVSSLFVSAQLFVQFAHECFQE